MEDQLVSFEVAKLAKEKGFNLNELELYYDAYGQITPDYMLEELGIIWFCPAPTQSLLQRWLREIHNIHIIIEVVSAGDGEEKTRWLYCYVNDIDNYLRDEDFGSVCDTEFDSYELALEEALKEVLELIE